MRRPTPCVASVPPYVAEAKRRLRMSLPQLFDGDLSPEFVRLIKDASRRVWIEVPWWHYRDTPGPADIFHAVIDAAARGCDVKVLIRNEAANIPAIDALNGAGVAVRTIRYLHEKCLIVDDQVVIHSANFTRQELHRNQNSGRVLVDADVLGSACFRFDDLWEADAGEVEVGEELPRDAADLLPDELIPYLTQHPRLNPCQASAVPVIVGSDRNVVLTARTGAGKTLVGQVAALRSIVQQNRRAVWLSPSVALTGELFESFERWRGLGLRVVRLTGEAEFDPELVRRSQLWVATTEKFESICRGTALAQEVAEIGCVIVDEIHLVGQEKRGPTLEALLARLRMLSGQTRIVGLSATLDNVKEIAEWLQAVPVESVWRPVHTTYQVVGYPWSDSGKRCQETIDQTLLPIVDQFRESEGQVLVFCGSKFKADRTARLLSGLGDSGLAGDGLAQECRRHGVGLHYRGLSRLRDTAEAFREGTLKVLVATSGLAQGVNLPARAVIVRDNQLGISPLRVDDAMQMMGRAGRVGLETEGHAFLLVPEAEVALWGTRLSDGHHAESQILDNLEDHILADVMLQRIASANELRRWYEGTLAFHQGESGEARLEEALELLLKGGFMTLGADGDSLICTDFGKTTSKFMVEVVVAMELKQALGHCGWPGASDDPSAAENKVIAEMARSLTRAKDVAASPRSEDEIRRFLAATPFRPLLDEDGWDAGALKTLLVSYLALWEPGRLKKRSGEVASIRITELAHLVTELPRYFSWLGAAGSSSDFDWSSPIAIDLGVRLKYWNAGLPRGAGRLVTELKARTSYADRARKVPEMFRRLHSSGVRCPEDLAESKSSGFARDDRNGRDRVVIHSTSALIDGSKLKIVLDAEPKNLDLVVCIHAGAQASILRSRSWTGESLSLDLPPGSEGGRIACDILGYSRLDWGYSGKVFDLGDEAEQAFDQAIAEVVSKLPRTLDEAPSRGWIPLPRFVEASRQRTRVKRFMKTDRLKLRPVAENLCGVGDAERRLNRLYEETASLVRIEERDSLRSPTKILRSAVLESESASSLELALATTCLARSVEFEAEIVKFKKSGDYSAAVSIDGRWLVPHDCPDEEIEFYTGSATGQAVEVLAEPEPIDPQVLEPNWLGLASYLRICGAEDRAKSEHAETRRESRPNGKVGPFRYGATNSESGCVAADAIDQSQHSRESSPRTSTAENGSLRAFESFSSMTPFELGELGTPDTVPFLKLFLASEQNGERRLAASALGKIAKRHPNSARDAYPQLLLCVDDPYPQVRQYSLKAISVLGINPADLSVIQRIADTDDRKYNREAARRILGTI